YTRILISNPQTEICVSVRTAVTDPFSLPSVIVNAPSLTPEAATLTTDKNLMYYHKKNGSLYKIFMRYRNNPTNTGEMRDKKEINVFPNPSSDYIYFNSQAKEKFTAELYNITGMILKTSVNPKQLDISDMSSGVYILKIIKDENIYVKKIIKK
ncbi:MAG: T9SS type A sorting domain-containing protein, partial [Bacteroidales bacterium]|nr:T9SS type A sorting domain-containing protein [Bacteroidales bacterium]